MLAKYVRVLIRRDMAETISTAVFEHELEILRDIHGEANVEELPDEMPSAEIDAGEEFDRLASCYGTTDQGQLYVERCIGRGVKQLEAFYGGVSEPVKKAGRPKKQVEQDEE